MGWDPFGSKASKQIKQAAAQNAAMVKEQAAEAAEAAKAAAKAQADAFRFNASVYARNADVVEQQALIDESRQRRSGTRFLGEQDAAIAASGFQDVGFEEIRSQTEEELDLDAIIIRRQGQFKAADYLAEEQLAYMNADSAIKAGEATARNIVLEGNIRAHGIVSGAETASQQVKSGSINSLISTGVSVAAIAFSDARIKENVERVGEAPNGLGVYAFNYIWEPANLRRVGFMAHEVRERFPGAIGKSPDGILTVDYQQIGLPPGYSLNQAVARGAKT